MWGKLFPLKYIVILWINFVLKFSVFMPKNTNCIIQRTTISKLTLSEHKQLLIVLKILKTYIKCNVPIPVTYWFVL